MSYEVTDSPPGFAAWLNRHPPAGWSNALTAYRQALNWQASAAKTAHEVPADRRVWEAEATLRDLIDQARHRFVAEQRASAAPQP